MNWVTFRLDEEMIETLFVVNTSNSDSKETNRRVVLPSPNQENRVLDPKKSQNIAILLRALNVTTEEVCEALLEGILRFFHGRHNHTTGYVYHTWRKLLTLFFCCYMWRKLLTLLIE